jgi:cytidylate kinase
MPWHPRIVAAGYPMHAILRGIDRGTIFFPDTDNQIFLEALAEQAAAVEKKGPGSNGTDLSKAS